jgi:Nitroreductase family
MSFFEAGVGTAPDTTGLHTLDQLGQRFSVGPKYLVGPGPSADEWTSAARLALRAPDHGGLQPFRFVIVGDGQRAALSELFAQGAQQRGQRADEIERARARAFNGPGLAALVARVRADVPDVPAHEQWLCVGAALMNFLNALHLMGFGAKALSGASVSDPVVHAAFCGPGELLASWVIAGRPTRAAHPRAAALASPVISHWHAAQPGRDSTTTNTPGGELPDQP